MGYFLNKLAAEIEVKAKTDNKDANISAALNGAAASLSAVGAYQSGKSIKSINDIIHKMNTTNYKLPKGISEGRYRKYLDTSKKVNKFVLGANLGISALGTKGLADAIKDRRSNG